MFGQKEQEQATMPTSTPTTTNAQNVSANNARLLTVSGDYAKIEGTFEIADSLEVECEIGGELNVRGKLVIGQQGVVTANVRTVDAVIKGSYEGNMVATGNVEIAATGRVMGNITTDSLVISKGGFFNGNVTRIKDEDKAQRLSLVEEDRRREERAQQAQQRTSEDRDGGQDSDRTATERERAVQNARTS